ncbi:transmembrane 9 superfamily member 5 isoform X1 [Syzygium oleosum]|uniref:transmembrane 9 superfamily member 5 isoform X1 n=1 Tax=Syzygium oleosum TaxID=219896 RepID=UPI0011D25D61|nr:transmembrane 9 superfamily member 5 isoform X1 [Syzygium oleosum]
MAFETRRLNLLLALLAIISPGNRFAAAASPEDHRYNVGDPVPLFANRVGPLHNPSETYEYYDLAFCCPDPLIWKSGSLGEVLNGDRLTNSLYNLKFREVKDREILCEKKLKVSDVARLRNAVNEDFYFQMYYDDLPMWGFIGKVENSSWSPGEKGPRYYLFKHVQFDAFYNGDQIIEIHAFSDPNHVIDITDDVEVNVKFTYSAFWNATSIGFEERMSKYSRASLLPIHQQIHWFSLINSSVILILLMGLLTLLFMRRIRNDLRQYSAGDDEEENDFARKYICGELFRPPSHFPLFCAVLGSGMQLLTMVCFLSLLAFLGVLYPYSRGSLCTALVLSYIFTSVVGGFTATSFQSQFAETGSGWTVPLTGIVYLGPVLVIAFVLNTISMAYGATAALPVGTIFIITFIFVPITVLLLYLGGVIRRFFRTEICTPSITRKNLREIPPLAWYKNLPCQMILGGLLSFSSVVLELYELYTTLWGFKISVLPGTLFVTFVILIIVTAVLSVVLTHIQLSSEDHDWWWRCVFRGGSAAIFMFAYCLYFYARSNMSGFLQLSIFLGYSALMCYAFFLILGTVGFIASLMFVCRNYEAVKSE